jgi:hypothetical protein
MLEKGPQNGQGNGGLCETFVAYEDLSGVNENNSLHKG